MDPNPFKPTRSTFFSRVYAAPQSANSTSHLPTTRPQASTPSFFGKSHTPHSTRRTSEFNTSSTVSRDSGGSTVDAEDHSIYAGYKNHRYFPQGVENEGGNVPPRDSMEEVPHMSYPLKSEPTFSSIQAARVPSVASRVSNHASSLSESIRRTSTGPSASSSITVKVEEGGEDDIPVSIRNSFRELRSVKDELESQRSENERLRAELAASQKTVADTLTRLDNVKQMTKKSIKSTSNELAELHAALVLLKAQSNESFAFAAQARSALPDISGLRSTIEDSSQKFLHLTEDLTKLAETKEVIRDLESERVNGRKANDLLRDKLTDFASQYADAMERLQNAERLHASQTNALRVVLDDIHNTNLLAAARSDKLEATQKELSDALIACALADENAALLEKRAEKLALDVEEKALIIATLQRENIESQALLNDKESSVGPLLSLKDEVLKIVSSSSDRRSELATLRQTLEEQLRTIGELNGRCHSLEHEIGVRKQELANQTNTLHAEREASHERENSLNRTIERFDAEISAKEARSKVLLDEIQVFTEERKREHERMMELQMRCQALQVRFEDQSASLKLARESHGDMQERLITAETAFAVKLDAETGKLRQEVLVLQERNGMLQRSVDESRRQLENQQESSMVTRNEYEKKLKDERDNSHTHIQALQALQGRMLQADLEKTQAYREAEDLRNSLATAHSELMISREQAQNIQTSLSAWGGQVKDLTTQNHALQTEKVLLLERSHNISTRYETNELSVEEKAFVNHLLEESRTFHEKRILDKQNELRRRDNQIAEQEARIKSLEKGLARYLKSQDPKFTPRNDAQSILNLSKFAASSSPPEPVLAGADADKGCAIGGACTSPPRDRNYHLLEPSSEVLKGSSNEVQSSYATIPTVTLDGHEGVSFSPKLARDSPEATETPSSNITRAVKLGKHGRPHSQTSQEESGNINDVTRPPRRLKSSRKPGPQTSEFKAEPEQPKPRARKRK